MKYTNKTKTKRGSILVTLLFLMCVLALLVATVANDSLQTLKTVSQSGRDTQAKYAAYAGMEMVMNELRKQDRYLGEEVLADDHGRLARSLTELSKVSYDVLIWNNMRDGTTQGAAAPEREAIDGPRGVVVQPDTVYMEATGKDNVRGEEVVLMSLAGTARRVRPVFEDAAYARTKMIMLGDTLVDAWDSTAGWGGGLNEYRPGDFPGQGGASGGGPHGSGGNGSGHGQGPTVEDYKATLGTDAQAGRTMRLLGTSQLNGFFRIGPGVDEERAFSADTGTTSSSSSSGTRYGGDGDSQTAYGVSTAVNASTQIAGEDENGGATSTDNGNYFKLDDKSTEMPRFTAPYDADDLAPPPAVSNPSSTRTVTDYAGNQSQQYVPPAPVGVEPGGYQSIHVPSDQTLQLSPGVYYFSDEMRVEGKVELTGSDPVIVFVGKKAVFTNAEINKDGKTSSFQLCFTDELKDEEELTGLVEQLEEYFELPAAEEVAETSTTNPRTLASTTASTAPATTSLPAYIRSILAPTIDPTLPDTDENASEGASVLEINGGELFGSISGKNLVVLGNGGDIFGGVMANVVKSASTNIHQDLALKGSNLMNSGGWSLEGVHQVR